MNGTIVCKIADSREEFEQIHRLNHDTFAKEIPQHHPSPDGRLIDKFHSQNIYFICLLDGELIGMMAARDQRPFSLDAKLSELDSYLPAMSGKICEIRLLSIRPEYRAKVVIGHLFGQLAEFALERGWALLVISGTVRQLKLYRHVGFIPFGPLVGSEDALYQPMYLNADNEAYRRFLRLAPKCNVNSDRANFLPGPVGIRQEVYKALAQPAISHRSEEFHALRRETVDLLCRLTRAGKAEVLVGTGTLANDVIAAQLSLLDSPGLVLSNGEFGERLIDHATRARLEFQILRGTPGTAFSLNAVRRKLEEIDSPGWLWFAHCETSTGILNDMAGLKALAAEFNLKLCVDCISSIGMTEVDLSGVYLASGVSGKALGGLPGLALVFYHHRIKTENVAIPRYLDLALYAKQSGVPFTGSSNLLMALRTALEGFDLETRCNRITYYSDWIRRELHACGYTLPGKAEELIPGVISVEFPPEQSSTAVAQQLEKRGISVSFNSDYLRRANRIQICLMGSLSRDGIEQLLKCLCRSEQLTEA